MTATSGRSADTAVSVSPVNGQVMSATPAVCAGRSVPRYPRKIANGRPEAPAR